jgi:hypothetical protein
MPLTKDFPQYAEAWKVKLSTPIESRRRGGRPAPRVCGQAALRPYGGHALAMGKPL